MIMNKNQTGDLKKTTIRIGSKHEINIAVGKESIKAVIRQVDDSNWVGAWDIIEWI